MVEAQATPARGDPAAELRALTDAALAAAVSALLEGWPAPPLPTLSGPFHATLRQRGRALHTVWRGPGPLRPSLAAALAFARSAAADAVQVDLGGPPDEVPLAKAKAHLPNALRGLVGLGIELEGRRWHAPSQMIATNRSFERCLARDLEELGLDPEAFVGRGGRLVRFGARQLLIRLDPTPRVDTLIRGGRLVRPEDMTPATVAAMAGGMAGWLRENLHPDGRMTYKYWPSRGEESSADNTIRQFMATVCLFRLAAWSGRADDRERAARNLRHSLARFYRQEGELGIIVHDGSAKLGAAALAALAILEAGPRGEGEGDLAGPLSKLEAGVLALRQEDGSFRTFHLPPGRNDNQNFYPGEALLFLARRLERRPDPVLLGQCLTSMRWYQSWHRQNRNPAFIPWHSRAATLLHRLSGEAWLRAWVFEMNDWLTGFQQWGEAPAADLAGRFYDPRRPELGPPHASSTGVYLEGLADALALAEEAGDPVRAERYRRTIWRGLRSLRQLQFEDELDMFYVRRRRRVRGGVRTEAYDNTIRVDNVQHALMALLELRRRNGFWPDT